jgi:hypothetical protein
MQQQIAFFAILLLYIREMWEPPAGAGSQSTILPLTKRRWRDSVFVAMPEAQR